MRQARFHTTCRSFVHETTYRLRMVHTSGFWAITISTYFICHESLTAAITSAYSTSRHWDRRIVLFFWSWRRRLDSRRLGRYGCECGRVCFFARGGVDGGGFGCSRCMGFCRFGFGSFVTVRPLHTALFDGQMSTLLDLSGRCHLPESS